MKYRKIASEGVTVRVVRASPSGVSAREASIREKEAAVRQANCTDKVPMQVNLHCWFCNHISARRHHRPTLRKNAEPGASKMEDSISWLTAESGRVPAQVGWRCGGYFDDTKRGFEAFFQDIGS